MGLAKLTPLFVVGISSDGMWLATKCRNRGSLYARQATAISCNAPCKMAKKGGGREKTGSEGKKRVGSAKMGILGVLTGGAQKKVKYETGIVVLKKTKRSRDKGYGRLRAC